jgi:polyisoprenoid-binding protein YceI
MRGLAIVSVVAGLLFGSVAASAAAIEFDLKDPKGVNSMSFTLDSELEPILGLAAGISGKITFDPDKPEATDGLVIVDAASLHTENKGMKDTLHGPDWLNVKEHPEIKFNFKKVVEAKKGDGGVFEMKVTGDFECKGKTKEMTIPVRVTYLKGKLGNRQRGLKGDLLVVRTEFTIKRSDFEIKPDMGAAVVAEEIRIFASICGTHVEK